MHANMLRALVISFIATAAVGCGKEGEPSGDTTSAKASKSTAADSASASSDGESEGADAEGKTKAKKKKSNDDGLTIVRKAKDYITTEGAVFMYSFNESDAKGKAEKACNEKTKGDSAKQAICMTAAQKKFGADGYHFTQDDSGKWYWEIVKINNGVVTNLHRLPIEFAKEDEKSIQVKVIGKDEAKGAKGYVPSEVTFEVPNSYEIIQSDPDEGKIVFEAKLGLMGDQAKKKKK
jgi:hypothetical protein